MRLWLQPAAAPRRSGGHAAAERTAGQQGPIEEGTATGSAPAAAALGEGTGDSDSDPMDCAHSWWACRYVAYESALGTPSTAPACPGPF